MQLDVSTSERVEVVDVTDRVAAALGHDIAAGLCVVSVQHTTAGVVLNEDEPRLRSDLLAALRAWVPGDAGYAHDELDHNADAHLRAVLLGSSVSVPIVAGRLALGTWQSVLLVECDGPRERRLQVTAIAS